MKHAKIKAAEDEREQLEEEINSLRTDLRLARSNTKIYGEKERGKKFLRMIVGRKFRLQTRPVRVIFTAGVLIDPLSIFNISFNPLKCKVCSFFTA